MGEDTAGDYGGGDPPKEEQPWDRKNATHGMDMITFGDGMGRVGERSSARTMQTYAGQGREASDPMGSGGQCAAGATPVVGVGLDIVPDCVMVPRPARARISMGQLTVGGLPSACPTLLAWPHPY